MFDYYRKMNEFPLMSVLYKIIALVKNIINETARLFGKAVAINSMHTDSMQMELPTHVDALQ